jgi:hypothetical protein
MALKFCDEDLLRVTVKIPESLHESLLQAADDKGVTMSFILRAALIKYLEAGK